MAWRVFLEKKTDILKHYKENRQTSARVVMWAKQGKEESEKICPKLNLQRRLKNEVGTEREKEDESDNLRGNKSCLVYTKFEAMTEPPPKQKQA